ncbi:Acetylornithine deacetylase (ArgE) [Sulfitobacter noctilucicola]|nr:Acetylornithine deacetylase (ArgE) [Sulfitobacter noctilucicola]
MIDWVQALLADAGFEVTRIWSPDRTKAGLFARIGPNVDGGICLSAHTDVVPVDGQLWTRPPFELTDDGDRVIGRGTTDMKGFLASALATAERAGQGKLSFPLSLSISYDEEIGCVGIQQMMPELRNLIGTPRLVIVGEPTSMQVATGHKGKSALNVTCHGQAGHSALAPDFVNAIHVAAGFVTKIQGLQDRLKSGAVDKDYRIPYSTVHIGKISGGTALNIVPSETQVALEFRHLAETPAREIESEIRKIADDVSQAYPCAPKVDVDVVNSYPGLDIEATKPIVTWASDIAGTPKTTKVSFGTEAGFFSQLGLDTVVLGPGDMATDGHKPDEGLAKSELISCDRMMDQICSSLRG